MSNAKTTIKQQISELDAVLAWFESEDFAIEQASEKYAEAQKIVADIEAKLANIKNELVKV